MSAKEVKKEKITKEELKDRLMKSRALSDDELEQVSGGSSSFTASDGLSYIIIGLSICYNPGCPEYLSGSTVYNCGGINRCTYCEQPVGEVWREDS